MKIAVTKETFPGERRVALVPANVPALTKGGMEVIVERGAGAEAGYPDAEYAARGAALVGSREEAIRGADCLVQVRALGANLQAGKADLELLRAGQAVIGLCEPLACPQAAGELAEKGVSLFSLELMPRITRAQGMDVLSSMATVAGYRAVLLAAIHLPRMFPMLMTAAGTLAAAKVFIVGAGVAGLQAIATARRLGGVARAYDVRPAVKEQVESLGAKFLEMDLETARAEGAGGYAQQMDEAFYKKQRELMARAVAESDVVITTASIPGKKAPVLITADAIAAMQAGSVVVDLAAERGGNCESTVPDQVVVVQGVTIVGPTNLPSDVPYHASQMFGRNVTNFLLHLVRGGGLHIDLEDEITRGTLVAHGGRVVEPRVLALLTSG